MAYAAAIVNGRATVIDTRTRSVVRRVGHSTGIELVASNGWIMLIVHNGGEATLYRMDTGHRLKKIASEGVINIDLSEETAVLSFNLGRWEAFDLRRLRKRVHTGKGVSNLNHKLQQLLKK